jgi:hypothetical protein
MLGVPGVDEIVEDGELCVPLVDHLAGQDEEVPAPLGRHRDGGAEHPRATLGATEDHLGDVVDGDYVGLGAEGDLEGVFGSDAGDGVGLGRVLFTKTWREAFAVLQRGRADRYTLRERRVNSPSQSKLRIEHGK